MGERGTFRQCRTTIVIRTAAVLAGLLCSLPVAAAGQTTGQKPSQANALGAAAVTTPPPGYVIGYDDVLSIVFWLEKDMSAEVIVRPDGKITLPLINDIQALGLTPEQLRVAIQTEAEKFVEDATVSVMVKAINSRKVFITGAVEKPGPYPLTGPTTVLQLIATAGGLSEWAKSKDIVILRNENGKLTTFRFNYNNVQKNFRQNIELKPGDTVVVPQ